MGLGGPGQALVLLLVSRRRQGGAWGFPLRMELVRVCALLVFEGLLEVLDEVIEVFDADGEADEAVHEAGGFAFFSNLHGILFSPNFFGC